MRNLTNWPSCLWAEDGRRNRALGRVLTTMWATHFGISYTTTFYEKAGLDYLQIFGTLAILAIFTGISEIAFGLAADGKGNKRVLVTGLILQVFSSWAISQAKTFWEMAAATVLTSISWSMTSSTVNSIVKASSAAAETSRFNMTSPRYSGAGAITGVVIGAVLFNRFGIDMVFEAQPVTFLVGLAAAVLLVDKHSTRQMPSRQLLGDVLLTLFVRRPDIRWRMLLAGTVSTGALATLWLIQPDMANAGFGKNVFGWLYLIRAIVGTVLALCSTPLYKRLGDMRTQLLLLAVVGGSAVASGLPLGSLSKAGPIALLLATAMEFTLVQALMANAINDAVPQHQTTTAQSTYSSVKALFGITIIPIGLVQKSLPTDTTLVVIGVTVLAFGSLCYARQLRASHGTRQLSDPH